MPRAPRILHPGAWYHVTARGIERRPIFRDTRDRSHFRELLAELVERFAVRLHAFVLMENHYHLLLELAQPNLSRAIQWLNVSYSVWFNRRHGRCGYLFQGRFKSIVVEPRHWGVSLSAYIHLNPVRIARLGLGKTDRQRAKAGAAPPLESNAINQRIKTLRAHRWSSYRSYIGLEPSPPWLTRQAVFEYAGGSKGDSQANYRKYVEAQIRNGRMESPWQEIRDQILLSSAQFARQVKKQALLNGHKDRWAREALPLEKVIKTVETVRGAKWEQFRDKHGDNGRDLVLYLARRVTGLTVSELARQTGLTRGENVSMAVKRCQKRIDENRAERKLAAQAAQMLSVML
jgi:putative transposase